MLQLTNYCPVLITENFAYCSLFYIQCGVYCKNLWAKRGNLMETFYLKGRSFGNRYPEWMPNLTSNRGQDSNPCAWGSLAPHSARGYTCYVYPPTSHTI